MFSSYLGSEQDVVWLAFLCVEVYVKSEDKQEGKRGGGPKLN